MDFLVDREAQSAIGNVQLLIVTKRNVLVCCGSGMLELDGRRIHAAKGLYFFLFSIFLLADYNKAFHKPGSTPYAAWIAGVFDITKIFTTAHHKLALPGDYVTVRVFVVTTKPALLTRSIFIRASVRNRIRSES
jgi:hypothetical protein